MKKKKKPSTGANLARAQAVVERSRSNARGIMQDSRTKRLRNRASVKRYHVEEGKESGFRDSRGFRGLSDCYSQ